MEQALRDLIAENSNEEFRGVYVESGLSATRSEYFGSGFHWRVLRRKQL